ncbi:hypothetical protein [Azospirillum lipoferum]|uniref:Methyl-accepting chemotaxis protein n=1 Tax=Azospirillum lipoferum (strain 4B) TaxID=862719 RepID=G7Z3V6_AZOL4|nr:hypothetical protein [Azospirillum lipoferum]CBS86075.1 Protein of unknown function [Azospirillum lipoferum 4B]
MFDAVIHAANNPVVIALIASLIVAFGVLVGLRASARFQEVDSDLRSAASIVEAVASPARFGPELDAMEHAFRRKPGLQSAWIGIEATLAPPTGDDMAVVATVKPSEFLSIDLLRQANINVALYQAVPGYLVGTGLLFTFISLLLALVAATGTMSAATATATHVALQGLLSAAAMKFTCSIAGLLASIVFSWWLRHRLHGIEARIDDLGRLLDSRIPVRHPIQLIAETNALLTRQITVFQSIDTQWRDHLVENLSERTAKAVGDGMKPLVTVVNEMTAKVGELSRDSMEKMIGAFTRRLEESLSSRTADLLERLETLCRNFQSLIATVEGMDKNLAEAIDQSTQALDERVSAAADHMNKALHDGSAGMIGGLLEGSRALTASAADATRQMEGQLADTAARLAARLDEAGNALHGHMEKIDNDFQTVSAQLNGELTTTADRIITDLGRAAGAFRNADERTTQALPEFLGRLEGLVAKVNATGRPMEELAHSIELSTTALRKAFDASSGSLSKGRVAVERVTVVAESVAAMHDTFKALAQAVGRMEQLEAAAQAVGELVDHLSGLDRVLDTLNAMTQRLGALEASYAGLADAGDVLVRMRPPIEALTSSSQRVASLETPLAALAGTAQAVAEAGTSFRELSGTAEQVIALNRTIDRLAEVVETLASLEPVLAAIRDAAQPAVIHIAPEAAAPSPLSSIRQKLGL